MNTRVSISTRNYRRAMALVASMTIIIAAASRLQADTGMCGGVTTTVPFTDVMGNTFFCQIAEAYFSGLTNGTDATHFSPAANVPREQMAAFVTRALDQSLKRGSERAALNQFWTNQGGNNLGLTTVGGNPQSVKSDGADLWVPSANDNTVLRVRASDGKVLETWTGADSAVAVLCAMGKVFVTGETSPAKLYQIDPTQGVGGMGVVTTVTSSLGTSPEGIAFDGQRIWTANLSGSVSIITLNPTSVTTVSTGFGNLLGIVYDGANMWVTDNTAGTDKLHKLNSSGGILLSVDVGNTPARPAFDGTNIWVPNNLVPSSVTVVRASTATVLATLTGNGLFDSFAAAFDGERIMVTNKTANSISLFKASDFTPIGTFPTGASTTPTGVCSDGLNFWITFVGSAKLARF